MTPEEINELLDVYILSLPEKDRIAYEIAKSHLGSSFNLRRSNGFKEFVRNQRFLDGTSLEPPA